MATTKQIVWENPDGTLEVTVPVRPQQAGESETDYLTAIATRSQPSGATRINDVESTALPDRRWRDAWRNDGGGDLEENLTAAKTTKTAEIKTACETCITTVNEDYLEAEMAGSGTAAIATRGNNLRTERDDPDLSSITTISGLTSHVPQALQDEGVTLILQGGELQF